MDFKLSEWGHKGILLTMSLLLIGNNHILLMFFGAYIFYFIVALINKNTTEVCNYIIHLSVFNIFICFLANLVILLAISSLILACTLTVKFRGYQ